MIPLAITSWSKIISGSVLINSLIDSNWGTIDLNQVLSITKHRPLVINCSRDPMSHYEEQVVETLLPFTDNFVVLSGDIAHFKNPKPYICYFPYWYLSQQSIPPQDIKKNLNQNRKYKLSCLNGRSRYHRIENYVRLKSQPYFDKLLFVMHNNFDRENEIKEAPNSTNQNLATVWNESYVTEFLSDCHSFHRHWINDHSVDHPAYTDSYINYVTESSAKPDILFLSEKTWKPFMSGQFGIWLGNPGTVEFLRSIGFDVFDDLIDHSYDCELDFHRRIELLHQSISQIINMDLEQLFISTEQRRLHNQNLFYSNYLKNLLTKQVKDYESKISKL
jgi:hypothetical protein